MRIHAASWALGALIALIVALPTIACKRPETKTAPSYEDHPLYRNYVFSDNVNVMEIGVPTPWATVGHMVEVMKRDRILRADLARRGYMVKFIPFHKGEEIVHFLKNKKLEGAIMGDMPTIRFASEGAITIVSLFHRGSVSLVTRNIYRIEDLSGKRVAYPHGSIAHYYLLKLLREQGMSEADIHHVPLDATAIWEALQQGDIHAFTTFEPTATLYTRLDPMLHVINRSYSSYGLFSVRKEYSVSHREALRAVLEAQFRSVAWLQSFDRNVSRASAWLADEADKMHSLPLRGYLKELDRICSEDLVGNPDEYCGLLTRVITGENSELRREFEFLQAKGLVRNDAQWGDVVTSFDGSLLRDVMKSFRYRSSPVDP